MTLIKNACEGSYSTTWASSTLLSTLQILDDEEEDEDVLEEKKGEE